MEGRGGSFALVFLLLFGLTFGFLTLVGATPDTPGSSPDSKTSDTNPQDIHQTVTPTQTQTQTNTQTNTQTITSSSGHTPSEELPTRIIVKKIGLNVSIANPNSTDVDVLDQYLLKGAVRYPTSGLLGQNGTVLLFGHSSYLPIVHNQSYKAFDGIQNLKAGDMVNVYAGSVEYQFSVTGVRVADASDENNNTIQLPQDAQHLTLVTCDSFASKSNRYVVTADLVSQI